MKSTTGKRLLVGVAASVTVGAGLPLLAGGPASAAPTASVVISGPSQQAAGNCLMYTVTARDGFGGVPSDSGRFTVKLTENPKSDTQDVDFCDPSVSPMTTLFARRPHYTNAPESDGTPIFPTAGSATVQYYTPGYSVTPEAGNSAPTTGNGTDSAGGNNPDRPISTDPQGDFGQNPAPQGNNINPSGVDTAQIAYSPASDGKAFFWVAGRVSGGATITAFRDVDFDESVDTGNADPSQNDISATAHQTTFSNGGVPGSPEAANAVTSVTVTCATPPLAPRDGCYGGPKDSYAGLGQSSHYFKAVLKNAAGDVVFGVTPRIAAIAGPNAPSASRTAGSFTGSCTQSGTDGVSTCDYRANSPTANPSGAAGTDTVRVWVNKTGTNNTGAFDAGEPSDTATAITTPTPQNDTTRARFISLTPETATTTAGSSQRFLALVTDIAGTPVKGATVVFGETGPGVIQGSAGNSPSGASTSTGTTDETGRAVVVILTSVGENGTETVTAAISGASDCARTDAPAGNCSDASTNVVSGTTASPSASRSGSGTPTPTVSGSRSASPTSTPTGTATATASRSTTPSPTGTSSTRPPSGTCNGTALTSLPQSFSLAGRTAAVDVQAASGSVVDLFAYSRPSTTFQIVRSAQLDSSGRITFYVSPGTNTRLYAQQRGCAAGNQVVLGVRTGLSIAARRLGTRTYLFSGDSVPARPGGLIISLYRVTASGSQVLTAQVRASSSDGRWSLTRRFSGTGRFGFLVRTGQDLQNAPGASNIRPTIIY